MVDVVPYSSGQWEWVTRPVSVEKPLAMVLFDLIQRTRELLRFDAPLFPRANGPPGLF